MTHITSTNRHLEACQNGAVELDLFKGIVIHHEGKTFTEAEVAEAVNQLMIQSFRENNWSDTTPARTTLNLLDRKIEEKKEATGFLGMIILFIASIFGASNGHAIARLKDSEQLFSSIETLEKEKRNEFLASIQSSGHRTGMQSQD